MSEFSVTRVAGALGATVDGVGIDALASSDELLAQFLAFVVEHEVVFLRDQHTPAPVFEAFASQLGDILPHDAYATAPDAPHVQVLESTAENPSKIEVWHSDMTFSASPPSFTVLHGQIIPEFGGDTLWASCTAAYAALSEPMRELLDHCSAVHDFRHGFRESLAESGGEERLAPAIAANPPVTHPVVRTHPVSGKKALYVNALFTTHIEGLTRFESERLLAILYEHTVAYEHTVRLNWAPGTVAIWDNRSTQHKPVNDFFPQHRKMHRVTIRGDRPV